MLGWEYRRPERVPAACPFKPAANKTDVSLRAHVTFSTLMLLQIPDYGLLFGLWIIQDVVS
jgi:hypothetical protein